MKEVTIAPVNSANYILTDESFYSFDNGDRHERMTTDKRIKAEQKYSKKNFIVKMQLEADGEKLIQVKIEKLKIFIKPHIFLTLYEMFVSAMPRYSEDSIDKPN